MLRNQLGELKELEWYGSRDGEWFSTGPYCNPLDAAIEVIAGCDLQLGESVYVGLKKPLNLSRFFGYGIDGEVVIERACEGVEDEFSDCDEATFLISDQQACAVEGILEAAISEAREKVHELGIFADRFDIACEREVTVEQWHLDLIKEDA